jgi:cytochrome c biogenesis protein CcdA/thiol-disulfide isomerase/thioredoxin
MLILLGFSFLAGIVTILSPCILPILPIVLSGSLTGDKKRPLGIVAGFIFSFTFFTLALTSIVKLTGIPSDTLRLLAVIILFIFGLSLMIPQTQLILEKLFASISNMTPKGKKEGLGGGIVIGLSLGLVWAPCVGPIMASGIALAATSAVNSAAILITLAYSLGTAIPMFIIMQGGRTLLNKIPFITQNSSKVQQMFGFIMIITSALIFFNIDRSFQTFILKTFPQYGTGLTQIEENNTVKQQIEKVKEMPAGLPDLGSKQAPNPTFIGATNWLNSAPLTLDALKGKVILIDFWTYTCINCIRTLPYVTSWYEKYKDKGLVVIGVHTPEFEFEKKTENVAIAMKDYKINYPVVQDNDYKIWRSYDNQYWPAEYIIDSKGQIRHTHFGEGQYDETEKIIQELLKEAGKTPDTSLIKIREQTPTSSLTPETYVGLARLERTTNSITQPGIQNLTINDGLPTHYISFGGLWDIENEQSTAIENAVLSINFQASKVFLVITPKTKTDSVTIYLDGKPIPPDISGKDVVNGTVNLDTERLYNLVDLKDKNENHILKLKFNTKGTGVYAFTFG